MNRSALILPLMLASSLACSEHDSKIGAQAIAPEAAMVGERPEKSGADLYKLRGLSPGGRQRDGRTGSDPGGF